MSKSTKHSLENIADKAFKTLLAGSMLGTSLMPMAVYAENPGKIGKIYSNVDEIKKDMNEEQKDMIYNVVKNQDGTYKLIRKDVNAEGKAFLNILPYSVSAKTEKKSEDNGAPWNQKPLGNPNIQDINASGYQVTFADLFGEFGAAKGRMAESYKWGGEGRLAFDVNGVPLYFDGSVASGFLNQNKVYDIQGGAGFLLGKDGVGLTYVLSGNNVNQPIEPRDRGFNLDVVENQSGLGSKVFFIRGNDKVTLDVTLLNGDGSQDVTNSKFPGIKSTKDYPISTTTYQVQLNKMLFDAIEAGLLAKNVTSSRDGKSSTQNTIEGSLNADLGGYRVGINGGVNMYQQNGKNEGYANVRADVPINYFHRGQR